MSGRTPYNPSSHNQILWIFASVIGVILMLFAPFVIIFFVFSVIVWLIYRQTRLEQYSKSIGFLGNQEDEILSVLALSAYLSKADLKVSYVEMDYIHTALESSFDSAKAKTYSDTYNRFLRSDISLQKVARKINQGFSPTVKIQLLHFLIGLITADHQLSGAEEQKLFAIARALRIPHSSVESLLAMFRFQRAKSQRKQEQKTRNQRKKHSATNNAYDIFGIKRSASDKELKKKYRQLAKKHHPDRFARMGPAFQKKAKEKFQLIQEAYELIKKERGLD